METDEAGKLRAFREKFGRGWDASKMQERDEEAEKEDDGEEGMEGSQREEEDNLLDLISGYDKQEPKGPREKKVDEEKQKADELKQMIRQRKWDKELRRRGAK